MRNDNTHEKKLHSIAKDIFDLISASPSVNPISNLGLFSGSFGVILFLSHYLLCFKDSKLQLLYERYLELCINQLGRESLSYAYCNGLTGVLSCVNFMNKSSLIDVDCSHVEKGYYNTFKNIMSYNISNFNCDLMYGGVGVALGYMHNEEFVKSVVAELNKSAIKDKGIVKWKSYVSSTQTIGYDISLSHGMSSIIIFLARVYKTNIMRDTVEELLKGVSSYVLSQTINFEMYGSHFPSTSLESCDFVARSQLAWCYGDLGVGIALWQAGEALDDLILCSTALDVLKSSSNRRDLTVEKIDSANICHGSAGIAMIFHYVYSKTSDTMFLDAYYYWCAITLNFKEKSGDKHYDLHGNKMPYNVRSEYELLEGTAGVGLTLLLPYLPKVSHDWRELLLLLLLY